MRKLLFKFISWLTNIYVQSGYTKDIPSRDGEDADDQAVRRQAALKLANQLPLLTKERMPYILDGIPSWLLEYCDEENPDCPALDIMFNEQILFFSFAPYGCGLFDKNDRLEALFIARLKESRDTVPLLPIFIDPHEVIAAGSLRSLAFAVDKAFHDSVKVALMYLPQSKDKESLPSVHTDFGGWASRRDWLEEAQKSSLFPL